jgi:hypothetical protein
MSNEPIQPQRAFALVVGIEKYAAGRDWDVDGPASDACRIVDWLKRCNVPSQNILLFLSPLDQNQSLQERVGHASEPATRERLHAAFTGRLSKQDGDLLVMYWAGHGVITATGTRKLFYANAEPADLSNLNLDSLLQSLRSDYWASFPKQIGFVEACANYVEHQRLPTTLPEDTFPAGLPVAGREQFVLLGARPGDFAKVASLRKTGVFTNELLTLLDAAPGAWPPDMDCLAERLRQRFISLREAGEADQTPAYYWYQDWGGQQGTIAQATATAPRVEQPANPVGPGQPQRRPPRELSFDQRAELIEHILRCPTMRNGADRNTVVNQLRPQIAWNIDRHNAAKMDVTNIVATCLNYSGGFGELLHIVRNFEDGSAPMQELDRLLNQLPVKF